MNLIFKRTLLTIMLVGLTTGAKADLSEIMPKPEVSSASLFTTTQVPVLSWMLAAGAMYTALSVKSIIDAFCQHAPDNTNRAHQNHTQESFGWKLAKLGLWTAGAVATLDYANRTYQSLNNSIIAGYINSAGFPQGVLGNLSLIRERAEEVAKKALGSTSKAAEAAAAKVISVAKNASSVTDSNPGLHLHITKS